MRIFGKVAIPKSLLRALLVCIALRLTIINAAGLETLRAECFPHLGGREGLHLSTSSSIHGILCSLSYRHFKFNFWRFPRSGSNWGLELVLWKGPGLLRRAEVLWCELCACQLCLWVWFPHCCCLGWVCSPTKTARSTGMQRHSTMFPHTGFPPTCTLVGYHALGLAGHEHVHFWAICPTVLGHMDKQK